MKILKYIPNILTLVRMILTLIYLHLLYALNSSNRMCFTTALIVFILICITDFVDGKIARALKASSPFGALLDVTADFVFIISSLVMLSVKGMIPMWFIAVVLGKFVEFLGTSYFIKKHQVNCSSLFIFDYFGRIAAVNFFLIPGLSLLLYIGLGAICLNIFIYLTLILVAISSTARIMKCYKAQKVNLLIKVGNNAAINKSI